MTAAYPATDLTSAVELGIECTNQLHQFMNGDTSTTITTQSGTLDSLRKILANNIYVINGGNWLQGTVVTEYNKIFLFTDGGFYFAKDATTTNPVTMGATPVGSSEWTLWPIGTQTSYEYTATGSEAGLITTGYSFTNCQLFVNGMLQPPISSIYTVSSGSVQLTSDTFAAGDYVVIVFSLGSITETA